MSLSRPPPSFPETRLNVVPQRHGDLGVTKISIVRGAPPRAFAMTGAVATVGRHATNDLVVDDASVSGIHLELRRVEGGVQVRDPGSRNGTWLAGHRITEAILGSGGEIHVGGSVLRFELDAEAKPMPRSERTVLGGLTGQSSAMREIFAIVERISKKDIGVLIQGETGTGKEELARTIHGQSPRAAHPFVVLDAASVPESVADVLIFGSETAGQIQPGLLESAAGGTVFIDEVSELSRGLQGRLLRVIERREIVRLGGQAPISIHVRFIASASRDLRQEIEADRFREDLYFRIAPMKIVMPPLRARLDDLALIAAEILRTLSPHGAPMELAPEAFEFLAAQPWPGNVRELRNALLRAGALATGNIISREDVAGEGGGFRGFAEEREPLALTGTFTEAKDRALTRFESAYLAALMRRTRGNLTVAAREAGLTRHHFRDLLRKRNLYGTRWDDDGTDTP